MRSAGAFGGAKLRQALGRIDDWTLAIGKRSVAAGFTVTSDGEVFGTAIFIMELLAPGTSPDTGDWRYVMVLSDDGAAETAPELA